MALFDALKITIGATAMLIMCHLYNITIDNPSVRREALNGYVLLSEKTAAEAKAAEMERQRNAAAQSLEEYRNRLNADREEYRINLEALEKAIAEDHDSDGSTWTADDKLWLCKQRTTPDCGK